MNVLRISIVIKTARQTSKHKLVALRVGRTDTARMASSDEEELNILQALPPELLLYIFKFLGPKDLCRISECGWHLKRVVRGADAVWQALYDEWWPAWTLLQHSTAIMQPYHKFRRRYRPFRATIELKDDRILLLEGTATDTYDKNVTPFMVALCRPPPHMIPADAEIDPSRVLLGQTRYGQGSLHNAPVDKTLLGTACYNLVWDFEWREHTGSFGHWVYKAAIPWDEVDSWDGNDGLLLTGRYHMSCLPRKQGNFVLRAVDPSDPEVAERFSWAPSSRSALTNRVLVKWAVGSIQKRVRQQEVLAGAAAVQDQLAAEQELRRRRKVRLRPGRSCLSCRP